MAEKLSPRVLAEQCSLEGKGKKEFSATNQLAQPYSEEWFSPQSVYQDPPEGSLNTDSFSPSPQASDSVLLDGV